MTIYVLLAVCAMTTEGSNLISTNIYTSAFRDKATCLGYKAQIEAKDQGQCNKAFEVDCKERKLQ